MHRRLLIAIFVVGGLALAAVPDADASRWVVDRFDDAALPGASCEDQTKADCTLRRAIALTNSLPVEEHEIQLPAGVLARDPALAAPVVTAPVTIVGAGARATTISGHQAGDTPSRALTIHFATPAERPVELRDLTVAGGRATGNVAVPGGGAMGGGVGAEGADVRLVRVTVRDNLARNVFGGQGGGVHVGFGDLTLRDSTIAANRAEGDGGSGAHSAGGGVSVYQGALDARNVTISGNTADNAASAARGGGIALSDGAADLRHVTVAGNASTGPKPSAGAVHAQVATVTWRSSVIAGSGPDPCALPGQSDLANVADAAGCFAGTGDAVVPAALLGPLADNGGPTDTHALLPGSPALDAAGPCGLEADQRGLPRPLGGGCDAGAVESGAASPPPPPPAGGVGGAPGGAGVVGGGSAPGSGTGAPGAGGAAASSAGRAGTGAGAGGTAPTCRLVPSDTTAGLRVRVTCDRATTLTVASVATVTRPRGRGARAGKPRTVALAPVRRAVAAARTATLTLVLPRALVHDVRAGQARVRLDLTATVSGARVARATVGRLKLPVKRAKGPKGA